MEASLDTSSALALGKLLGGVYKQRHGHGLCSKRVHRKSQGEPSGYVNVRLGEAWLENDIDVKDQQRGFRNDTGFEVSQVLRS